MHYKTPLLPRHLFKHEPFAYVTTQPHYLHPTETCLTLFAYYELIHNQLILLQFTVTA